MEPQFILKNILVAIALLFWSFLFFKPNQNTKLNWSIFYATIWTSLSLLLVNLICVKLDFWEYQYKESLTAFIPLDLFFVWVTFWAGAMTYFFKGKYLMLSALLLFWIDVLFMPLLAQFDMLELKSNWLVGELLLILFVFIPSQIWARMSFEQTHLRIRSLFQVLSIAMIYCFLLPLIVNAYFPMNFNFDKWYQPYLIQIGFIIALPALIAVYDLAKIGEGTPFPYDPTKKMVRSGVYAYIRNPIQWSMTLFFIPLAGFYGSYYLLFGVMVSIAYTIGVSNKQEYDSMEKRFGQEWVEYKSSAPAWYFLWKPNQISQGKLFFKKDCSYCQELKKNFVKQSNVNLIFEHAENWKGVRLTQLTYLSENGHSYSSIKAIAKGLEHINLLWASLAWFIRFPGVSHFLQAIVDSMDLNER